MTCSIIVTEKLCPKIKNNECKGNIPKWKIQLQRKVREIEQDLSRIVESRKRDFEDPMRKRLEKYYIRQKGFDVVVEELKQDLKPKSHKIKRYSERVKQYNQTECLSTTRNSFTIA